jgi:hypothetical protein
VLSSQGLRFDEFIYLDCSAEHKAAVNASVMEELWGEGGGPGVEELQPLETPLRGLVLMTANQ